jgi:hypothetical protein
MCGHCSTVSTMNRQSRGHWSIRWLLAVAVTTVSLAAVGCASLADRRVDVARLSEAVEQLGRPKEGDIAALYRLEVPRSGSLRMAVITAGEAGRLTVSEPFGSAVSLTAWEGGSPTRLFDMENGCQREVAELEGVFGVDALPLEQAARLLGGRLPAGEGDAVRIADNGLVVVVGTTWAVSVRVVPDPWRVVEVRELGSERYGGWKFRLGDHDGSVPGRIRLDHPDGRRAALDLLRFERSDRPALPPLPGFPPCRGR